MYTGIADVRFESNWHPFGTRVNIYGSIKEEVQNPDMVYPEIYMGYFLIDLFGNTDYIHFTFGDIPAWW